MFEVIYMLFGFSGCKINKGKVSLLSVATDIMQTSKFRIGAMFMLGKETLFYAELIVMFMICVHIKRSVPFPL